MDIITILSYGAAGFVIILLVGSIILWTLKEGTIEVPTNKAVVVRNIWTGTARALRQGTHSISPWMEKNMAEVSLENESVKIDAPMKAISGDGVKGEIGYAVTRMKVVDPVKALTEITFANRQKLVVGKIEAFNQNAFQEVVVEEIFHHHTAPLLANVAGGTVPLATPANTAGGPANPVPINGNVRRQIIKQITDRMEASVNAALAASILAEWGIEVKVEVTTVNLPDKFAEVAEEAATAQEEGEKIKLKAEAAGISPTVIALGDILADAVRAFKGGK